MNITDKARTITAVRAIGPSSLHLSWSDGTAADLDLGAMLNDRAFEALRDPAEFAKVEVGDWGHSLAWPSGAELGCGSKPCQQPGMATRARSSNGGCVMPCRCRRRPTPWASRAGWSPITPTARRKCQSRSCSPAGAGKSATGCIRPHRTAHHRLRVEQTFEPLPL